MKHTSLVAAAVMAMLCCPLFSTLARGHEPAAVGRHRHIAIMVKIPDGNARSIAINATESTARLDSAGTAPQSLDGYTGILIDVSGYPNVQRTPAPAIYGPTSDLVYPNRAHVPTPDQVQDESIVRYYRSMDLAKSGVCGSNPLVLVPVSIVGPGKDCVVLSAADEEAFKALDKRLHYMDTWKVGFLMPSNQ